jgi:hypothetical protein
MKIEYMKFLAKRKNTMRTNIFLSSGQSKAIFRTVATDVWTEERSYNRVVIR